MIYFIITFFVSVFFLTALFLNKKREVFQADFHQVKNKKLIRKLDFLFAKIIFNLVKYTTLVYEKTIYEIKNFPKRFMIVLHFLWYKISRKIDKFFDKIKQHKKIEKSKK